MSEGVDEAGWDVEPGDEIEAVGRLLRVCRESAYGSWRSWRGGRWK
ncbi:hypothetical protein [Streptomyces achromogenes]